MVGELSRGVVRDEVLAILAGLKQVPKDSISLTEDGDFLRELEMDSIDAVELTIQLDERFDIRFGTEADDIDSLACFGSLVDLVHARGRLDVER